MNTKESEEVRIEKYCSACRNLLPIENFSRSKKYYQHKCKSCATTYHRAWVRQQNPESKRKHFLAKAYGITPAEYELMLYQQNGVCAICGGTEASKKGFLAVDHDHDTGKIRELLCYRCNTGLGMFRDTADTLKLALAYLEGETHHAIPPVCLHV